MLTEKIMLTTKVLNVNILAIDESTLLKEMEEGVLITPNLDHLVTLQYDKEFYECYKKAEWVVCDSRILYLCSKLLKPSFPEAIPGSSFFSHFYEYHKNNANCKIFLLGAMNGVADKAREKINNKVGREIVVGAYSPSWGFETKQDENELIYKMIEESKATVVLVGVSAPKQEKWIFTHKDKMPSVKIWMALGATIDFEAGNCRRAPKIYQVMAIEWLYRIFQTPKKIIPRVMRDLYFFWPFFKQLIGLYRNPFKE